MYELNRIRLVGIGPAGARYDDVTLDLSGAGEPAGTGNLFDDGPRRPSPFSLLMLENGGGKSVLLKLIFSVVLPGRRKTVGGTSMDDYVLDGDTGHVVLEWMHAVTGSILLTGKVSERRARHASGNPLAESWYTLRPSVDLTLDSLPFLDEGRRRRLAGYRTAMVEAQRATPVLELTWCSEDHRTWRETLDNAGIDSDLFDIQRRMNLDEGDAAEAFTFSSAKGFVDWVLTMATDKDEVRSMADTFLEYSATVAERGSMIAERDFLEGAVVGLDALSEAHTAATEASLDATRAGRAAHELHRALRRRTDQEKAAVAELSEQAEAARAEATARSTARDAARFLVNEVKLQTLLLGAADIADAQQRNAEQVHQAELDVQAWSLLPELARVRQLANLATSLAEQVASADASAAPALERRDAAAAAVLAKLAAAAREADDAAAALLARARDLDVVAEQHQAARTRAAAEVARAEAVREAAAATLATATESVASAARAGLLPAGAGTSDVHTAHLERLEQHAGAQQAVLEARARVATAREEVTRARAAAAAAAKVASAADQRAGAARTAVTTARQAAARVVALPAVSAAAALGEEDVLDAEALDLCADTLLDVLRADAGAHIEALDRLRADRDRTDRLLTALGDGRLLPPRTDVEEAVAVLTGAGVTAYSGWRYLAEAVSSPDRLAAIAAHPDLADGVVLADPSQADCARDVLSRAELLPCAAIRVDSGAPFLSSSAPTGGFVIEPTPAMFDEAAAEERRVDLDAHREDLGHQLVTTEAALGLSTTAAATLTSWRQQYPRGAISALTASAAELDAAHVTALSEATACETAVGAADAGAGEAEEVLERVRDTERDLSDQVGALRALDRQVADAATAAQTHASADRTIRDGLRAQEEAAEAQGAAAQEAQEQRLNAERSRADARAHRTRAATIVSTRQEAADEVPAAALSDLISVWEAAQSAYAAVAAGSDLKDKADRAATAHQQAAADLSRRPEPGLRAAAELLRTDAAADQGLWEVQATAASERLAQLKETEKSLATQEGTLREAIRAARPVQAGRSSWVTLDEVWRPRSTDDGRRLTGAAEEALAAAQAEVEAANAQAEELTARRDRTAASATSFDLATRPLDGALRSRRDPAPDVPVAAYARAVETVEEQVERALTELTRAEDLAQACRSQVGEAVRELTSFAREPRFETLTSPARRSVTGLKDDELASRAAEFSEHLRARLASLVADLANADRHRNLLVERLANLVDQALKTLRQTQKLSELPADLGDWGRRAFLQIRFSQPDLATITVHVARVVDDAAESLADRSSATRGSSPTRDGMSLLLDGVHAAVPKGFSVTVLKPDAVLRDERVDIADMGKVFSGGQALTAAIVLYCTLAALRGNERGQMRAKHSGVLFLDNPIGKASATYLLALQKAVARSLGVQLIYTTGLSDDRVLAEFPLWVRLRNDADARANLKHISVAHSVRAALAVDDGDAFDGTLSATRVYRQAAVTGS